MTTESKEIAIIIKKESAIAVYTAPAGLDPYIQQIRDEVASFVPDITTKKGRDAVASMAYKVAKSKTYLDTCGKDLVAELKALPAKIDAERKRMREELDALRDAVRLPLTQWEKAEEARIANIKTLISRINEKREIVGTQEISEALEYLEVVDVDASFEEFREEALIAKIETQKILRIKLEESKRRDAEQAELARLRAEALEREQKEREERIAREAAQAERDRAERAAEREAMRLQQEAEQRETMLKLAAEQAKREALEAEQRAERAAQAERDKIADEQARVAAEQAKREADVKHKKAINNAAADAFVEAGFAKYDAVKIITLIAKGSIPNVSIKY